MGSVVWAGSVTRSLEGQRTSASRTTDSGVDVGGGIMGFLGDHVGARIDLRYFRAVSAGESILDFDFKAFSFWRFSGGLALRF